MTESNMELLISRIVGGEADDAEWNGFTVQAQADPALWQQLAQAQRDADELRHALVEEIAIAETVEAPIEHLPSAQMHHTRAVPADTGHDGIIAHLGHWLRWTGWAAAAVLAITIFLQQTKQTEMNPVPPGSDGTTLAGRHVTTPNEAINAYLELGSQQGSVIKELPQRILLQQRPNPDGEGYELLYLRQIVERAVVPDLYQVAGQTEGGQPTLVKYRQPERGPM